MTKEELEAEIKSLKDIVRRLLVWISENTPDGMDKNQVKILTNLLEKH